ncbi:MAG: U32 family peptidase [Treponema sp.]|nr:U32 family peptidase [Treponema sp.]
MPVELIAPAGSPGALDAAIGEGADAVYLGLKNFNAQMKSVNFSYPQFEAALRSLRRMKKKCYVAVNTVFEQREADRVYQLLKYLSAAGPDAIIVQDFGVLAMARSEFPKLKIHASTRMNIASGRGVNALSRHGVSRAILARELSFKELKSIRSGTNMELEIFVHGALCVSASGLCLFSSYLGGKSDNRGMCTQACRRLYHSEDDDAGSAFSDKATVPDRNSKRGYFFSPADLQLLDRLPDLVSAGINAFKIEGRTKSADYVGTVVSAYRLVLDAIESGDEEKIRQSIEKGKGILQNDFARSKTQFYFAVDTENPAPSHQAELDPPSPDKAPAGRAARGRRKFLGLPAVGDQTENFKTRRTENAARLEELDSYDKTSEYHEQEALNRAGQGLRRRTPPDFAAPAQPSPPGFSPVPRGSSSALGVLDWLNPGQDGSTGISLGTIQKTQGKGELRRGLVCGGSIGGEGSAKILPAAGDSIRLHRGDDSERVLHKLSYAAPANANGKADGKADGKAAAKAGSFWISIPDGFGKGDRVYLVQTRAMSKRYRPVIARAASSGGRSPGFEKAPPPPVDAAPKKTGDAKKSRGKDKPAAFPDGIYAAVSNINDLYIVQSSRPAGIILHYSRKTARYLLGEDKPLPFKHAEIIISLNPFFPEADAAALPDEIEQLADLGFRRFIANNLGHFSFFRNFRAEVQIIAGPWLYMFNRWALSFISSFEPDGCISPLENNRQNLERTLDAETPRSSVFVPVFAWPSLFRIRADLGSIYDFGTFSGSRDENFSLITGPGGSTVIPQTPFSITDKIPFLQEAGFRRFIVDLSGPPLKKNDYKDLMRAVSDGTPLPRITRFNWKNGFWNGDITR